MPIISCIGAAIALLEHVTQKARNSKSKGIKSESNRAIDFSRLDSVIRIQGSMAEHQHSFDVTKQGFPKPHELLPRDTRHWHSSIELPRDHERALGPRSSVWTTRIYRLRKPYYNYVLHCTAYYNGYLRLGETVCVVSSVLDLCLPIRIDASRLLSITTALQNVSSRWIVKQQGVSKV